MNTLTILAFIGLAAAPGDERAAPATVGVTGRHVESLAPETVRVRFRIIGEGKSLASAMEELDEGRKTIRARLDKLAGDKPQVALTEPQQLSKRRDSDAMARVQVMMMGGEKKKNDSPELLRMGVNVTLEWPLGTGAGRTAKLDAIRKAVKQLDIAAEDKEDDKASAKEEDEKGSKERGDKDKDEDSGHVRADITPAYYFVSRIEREAQAKALAAAFADARATADRLASAAGMKVGDLVTLSSDSPGFGRSDFLGQQQEAAMDVMSSFYGSSPPKFGDESDRPAEELVATEFKPLRHEVRIHATFSLK